MFIYLRNFIFALRNLTIVLFRYSFRAIEYDDE